MKQNVFLEVGFGNEEATLLALETDIAIAIARFVRLHYPSNQTAAAKHLKLGQNEISALLAGNTSRFSLQKLIRIARRAGIRLVMDTGDSATAAYATTHASTETPSPATFSVAQPISLLEDVLLGYESKAPSKVAASKTGKH